MSAALEREVRVRCSVAHAFETFTARIDLWWPPSHRRFARSTLHLEGRVGGVFVERAHDGAETRLGQVLRWEPPDCIAYTWYPGGGAGPTEVEIRFAADRDGTIVRVRHREGASELGPAWPERVAKFAAAWDDVLPAFRQHLDGANDRASGSPADRIVT